MLLLMWGYAAGAPPIFTAAPAARTYTPTAPSRTYRVRAG